MRLELQRADVVGRVERDPLLAGSEFVQCLGTSWREVLKTGRAKRAGANAVIFQQGDAGDAVSFLLSGSVRLFARRDADTVELGTAQSSELIGEGDAGQPRWCSAVASGQVEFVELERAALLTANRSSAALVEHCLSRLLEHRRRALDEMADFVNRW